MEVVNKNSNLRLVLMEKAPFKIYHKNLPKTYFYLVKKVDSFDAMKKAIIRTHGIINEKEMTERHRYYERINEFYIIMECSENFKFKLSDITGTLVPIFYCTKVQL